MGGSWDLEGGLAQNGVLSQKVYFALGFGSGI